MSPTDARRAMLRAEIERDWEMVLAQRALARTVDPSAGAPEDPALFPAGVERDWDELRRFRHFLRHAYPLDLDPDRLGRSLEHLERAIAGTNAPLRAVLQALE